MWRTLKEISLANGISRDIKFNNTELTIDFPNGSQIILSGASDEDDIETLRGSKYALVVVDECASFKSHFKTMIEEVIEPALIDLDGTLALIGTPGAACVGYFYDAATDPKMGYSKHHWTILDNPHIPNARGWIENRMISKGWTKENPVYMREWCGRFVRSDDSLVYRFHRERNIYNGKYPTGMQYILGVDFGWDDETAFCVLGFTPEKPEIYVCETFAKSKMLSEEIAKRIKELQAHYGKFTRMVADTGGLGKSICEEIKSRFHLPLHQAEKQGKFAFIDIINSDFVSGRILIPEGEKSFIEEMELLQWDDDEKGRRKEDPRYANHRCFVAGTLIDTPFGRKSIEKIKIGDFVLTESGCFPVYAAMNSMADTVILHLSDGRRITTTPNHPFKVGESWVAAENLYQQNLTVKNTSFVKAKDISSALGILKLRLLISIMTFGSSVTEIFQKVLSFITKTGTQPTTRLRTWNLCPELNMTENIDRSALKTEGDLRIYNSWKEIGSLQKNGTLVQKGISGTPSITRETSISSMQRLKLFARIAVQNISNQLTRHEMDVVATSVSQHDAELLESMTKLENAGVDLTSQSINTQKQNPVRVLAVEKCNKQTVYNISVAGDATYFVDGILVSNCDAFLYAAREAKHYLFKPAQDKPKIGSQAYYDKMEKDFSDKVVRSLEKQSSWWEN